MSLLTAAQQKDPNLGFAPDFVQVAVGPYLKAIKDQGIRVVSNAGGINPKACAESLKAAASKSSVDLRIAYVTGDNIMSMKEQLIQSQVQDMFNATLFPTSMTSMTAYLGAGAITKALDLGADIVVTGRCTDSALVLGPLMHEFKWSPTDYDLLASGSLAGHLIECGAQCTGGNFTDWEAVPDWHNIGFPIVECSEDGSFIVTKPPKTGGLVTPATCAEQMLYEIDDPTAYVLPDVVCDFSNVTFQQVSERKNEAVAVEGARGRAPTNSFKVSGTYADGFRLTAVFCVRGPRSAEKGHKTAEAILERVRGIFKVLKLKDFSQVSCHAIGGEGDEVAMWLAVQHENKKALQVLGMEIASAGTGMAPGLTGLVGGRPKVSPVLKLFSFLQPKNNFDIEVHLDDRVEKVESTEETQLDHKNETVNSTKDVHVDDKVEKVNSTEDERSTKSEELSEVNEEQEEGTSYAIEYGSHSFRLEDLAFTRSGDKGNNCNIGVIARHPAFVPYLRAFLTEEAVAEFMKSNFDDPSNAKVVRYEVPGVNGFNFVLYNSLGGGGIASVRVDPQGKAFGQTLLDFKIENVPNLLDIEGCSRLGHFFDSEKTKTSVIDNWLPSNLKDSINN